VCSSSQDAVSTLNDALTRCCKAVNLDRGSKSGVLWIHLGFRGYWMDLIVGKIAELNMLLPISVKARSFCSYDCRLIWMISGFSDAIPLLASRGDLLMSLLGFFWSEMILTLGITNGLPMPYGPITLRFSFDVTISFCLLTRSLLVKVGVTIDCAKGNTFLCWLIGVEESVFNG
jgi:hypothetical protein